MAYEVIRRDLEQKRQQLRQLVGERYRDLLKTAECIQSMHQHVAHLDQHFSANPLPSTWNPPPDASVGMEWQQNQQEIEERRPLFPFASLVQLLMTMSDQIWHAMERSRYTQAALLLQLAERVHGALKSEYQAHTAQPKIMHKDKEHQKVVEQLRRVYPAIQRPWDQVKSIRGPLCVEAKEYLKDAWLVKGNSVTANTLNEGTIMTTNVNNTNVNTNSESEDVDRCAAVCEALCALLLLQDHEQPSQSLLQKSGPEIKVGRDSDVVVALELFLRVRMEALEQRLGTGESRDLPATSLASSGGADITTLVLLVRSTLVQAVSIFLGEGEKECRMGRYLRALKEGRSVPTFSLAYEEQEAKEEPTDPTVSNAASSSLLFQLLDPAKCMLHVMFRYLPQSIQEFRPTLVSADVASSPLYDVPVTLGERERLVRMITEWMERVRGLLLQGSVDRLQGRYASTRALFADRLRTWDVLIGDVLNGGVVHRTMDGVLPSAGGPGMGGKRWSAVQQVLVMGRSSRSAKSLWEEWVRPLYMDVVKRVVQRQWMRVRALWLEAVQQEVTRIRAQEGNDDEESMPFQTTADEEAVMSRNEGARRRDSLRRGSITSLFSPVFRLTMGGDSFSSSPLHRRLGHRLVSATPGIRSLVALLDDQVQDLLEDVQAWLHEDEVVRHFRRVYRTSLAAMSISPSDLFDVHADATVLRLFVVQEAEQFMNTIQQSLMEVAGPVPADAGEEHVNQNMKVRLFLAKLARSLVSQSAMLPVVFALSSQKDEVHAAIAGGVVPVFSRVSDRFIAMYGHLYAPWVRRIVLDFETSVKAILNNTMYWSSLEKILQRISVQIQQEPDQKIIAAVGGTWEMQTIDMRDEQQKTVQNHVLLPAHPTVALTQSLMDICVQIQKQGGYSVDSMQVVWPLCRSCIETFMSVLKQSEKTLNNLGDKARLQLYLDFLFMWTVFKGVASPVGSLQQSLKTTDLYPNWVAMKDHIRSGIDPVDLALFDDRLNANAQKAYSRYALLLGALSQFNDRHADTAEAGRSLSPVRSTPSSTQLTATSSLLTEQHNIAWMMTQPPRLSLNKV